MVEHQTRDRKGFEFESRQERQENFLLTLIRCSLCTKLLQWHLQDPCHFAKSEGGRLQPNTRTPLPQRRWCGLTMLSRHSVGTYHRGKRTHTHTQPLSPQLAEECGLILAKKKGIGGPELLFKKKAQAGK